MRDAPRRIRTGVHPQSASPSERPAKKMEQEMERRTFGNTDLLVSTIGLGCYGMSGVHGPADDTQAIATIRRALDLGINFLDTSASYGQGHNHRLIGEGIRGSRHDVVIPSKSGRP